MSKRAPHGRASVLTPAGRGAVAVVAAEGAAALAAVDAHFQAANRQPIRRQAAERILFGHWGDDGHGEEVIVIRGAGDGFEIHCHGGLAASERIVATLAAAGCTVQPWDEWNRVEASSILEAEADEALARATTQRAAFILLAQRGGALRDAVGSVQQSLAHGEFERADAELLALFDRVPLGRHLTEPWHVAIAGRPNVGKSSLINALVGYQRAIVFDQPGTTRDVLTAETAIDGWPVRLADTAGMSDAREPLEAEGVVRARQQLARADLVLWVLDGSTLTEDPRLVAARQWREEVGAADGFAKAIVVVNKSDLATKTAHQPDGSADAIWTSARDGDGVGELLSAIDRRLVPAAPAGEAIPFTRRQTELLAETRRMLADNRVEEARAALARI